MEDKVVFSPSTLNDYLTWKLLRDRLIFLDEGIVDSTAQEICSQLEDLARESSEPITMIVTSPGGDVFAALAIYDTIVRMRKEYDISIIAEARGYAASAAAVIVQAADSRLATPHTRFLMHEVNEISFHDRRTVSDVEDEAAEMRKVNDMLVEIFAKRSGHPEEEIKTLWKKKDVWMSAQEALEWGLIDEIV